MQDQLKDVREIQAAARAFAAIRADGSVVTWGNPFGGGYSEHVQHLLRSMVKNRSTSGAGMPLVTMGIFGCVVDDSRALQNSQEGERYPIY